MLRLFFESDVPVIPGRFFPPATGTSMGRSFQDVRAL
jgi:hypothetical protein